MWAGQAVSEIGSRVTVVALPLAAALTLHASEFQMGALAAAGGAAALLFGLFAGLWADRLRRRPVLIATDLGRAAVLGSIPLAAALGWLTFPHLCLAAAAAGALSVFFEIAYQAYVPSLVERENVLEANSKLAITFSAAEIVGPTGAGALVQWITAPMAILVDAVSFLWSATFLAAIHKEEPPRTLAAETNLRREIAEGLAAVWRDPVLRALAVRAGGAAFFVGFPGALYMLFAVRDLRLGPALLGVVIAAGGGSLLLGAALAGRIVRRFGYGPSLAGSAILTGLAGLLVPLAGGPVWAAASLLIGAQLGDAGWSVYNVCETSLRQRRAPEQVLGRVNAVMLLLFRGGTPVGALAGGAAASLLGMRAALWIGAAGLLATGLWLAMTPAAQIRDGSTR